MARRAVEPIAFVGALPQGRGPVLNIDGDGEAILKIAISAAEAAKLVQRLPELMDVSFAVVCQPLRN
jgi:hypothetical protein